MKICAHRGSSIRYPENTLLAFDEALGEGADMLEFDLRCTKDNQCVVMHDPTVDRTTDGHGAVRELTYTEIRRLDAGQGQRVPNLDEVMAYGRATLLNVQVYADDAEDGQRMANLLAGYFRDSRLLQNAFITTANPVLQEHLRKLVPKIRLCMLQHRHDPEAAADGPLVSQVIQPTVQYVNKSMIEAAHARGLKVNVFFADDLDTANHLIAMGVDGILTNDPALLAKSQ